MGTPKRQRGFLGRLCFFQIQIEIAIGIRVGIDIVSVPESMWVLLIGRSHCMDAGSIDTVSDVGHGNKKKLFREAERNGA